MESLLALLLAIKHYSKDIHYASKGENFWADHLLADKIGDGLDDFMDRINEQIFLGWEKEAPSSGSILALAYPLIPNVSQMWAGMDKLLKDGLLLLNSIGSNGLSRQDSQLLDDIAADLQAKRGLLYRRLK